MVRFQGEKEYAEGRDRLVLGVAADGAPELHLLDEHGKVVGHLPPMK
jgi:hypothetical protein